jgi:hypothetical protein
MKIQVVAVRFVCWSEDEGYLVVQSVGIPPVNTQHDNSEDREAMKMLTTIP